MRLVAAHAALKLDGMESQKSERGQRPKGHRKAGHENQVAEIHRVAGMGIDAGIDDAFRRVAQARSATTHPGAVLTAQAILQVTPDKKRQPQGHDDQTTVPDRKLKDDDANGVEDKRPAGRAFQPTPKGAGAFRFAIHGLLVRRGPGGVKSRAMDQNSADSAQFPNGLPKNFAYRQALNSYNPGFFLTRVIKKFKILPVKVINNFFGFLSEKTVQRRFVE